MTKVIVFHRMYGCETGCCGHAVQMDDDTEKFFFAHPYGDDYQDFIRDLVAEEFGPEHVKDIDWDECLVSDA